MEWDSHSPASAASPVNLSRNTELPPIRTTHGGRARDTPLAHDLLVSRHRADPLPHAHVRRLGEVHRGKPHERGPVHACGRHAELTDEAVRSLQVLEELAAAPGACRAAGRSGPSRRASCRSRPRGPARLEGRRRSAQARAPYVERGPSARAARRASCCRCGWWLPSRIQSSTFFRHDAPARASASLRSTQAITDPGIGASAEKRRAKPPLGGRRLGLEGARDDLRRLLHRARARGGTPEGDRSGLHRAETPRLAVFPVCLARPGWPRPRGRRPRRRTTPRRTRSRCPCGTYTRGFAPRRSCAPRGRRPRPREPPRAPRGDLRPRRAALELRGADRGRAGRGLCAGHDRLHAPPAVVASFARRRALRAQRELARSVERVCRPRRVGPRQRRTGAHRRREDSLSSSVDLMFLEGGALLLGGGQRAIRLLDRAFEQTPIALALPRRVQRGRQGERGVEAAGGVALDVLRGERLGDNHSHAHRLESLDHRDFAGPPDRSSAVARRVFRVRLPRCHHGFPGQRARARGRAAGRSLLERRRG